MAPLGWNDSQASCLHRGWQIPPFPLLTPTRIPNTHGSHACWLSLGSVQALPFRDACKEKLGIVQPLGLFSSHLVLDVPLTLPYSDVLGRKHIGQWRQLNVRGKKGWLTETDILCPPKYALTAGAVQSQSTLVKIWGSLAGLFAPFIIQHNQAFWRICLPRWKAKVNIPESISTYVWGPN